MSNITLITSVVNTPNIPLSYIQTRSIYTVDERFEQTKKTIQTIREKIPNNKIFLIECSQLTPNQRDYFTQNTEIFINIYYSPNHKLINRMFTPSKSMGEGTMTIVALEYLFENNIIFDNLFKISGRYWLNDNFNYELYNNNYSVIKYINNDVNNALTALYKLPKSLLNQWYVFLLNSEQNFINCIGYEEIFAHFLQAVETKQSIEKIGISGNISVCGSYMDL